VIKEHTHDLKIPIIGNFPYGHNDYKYTLPIGCEVKLDCNTGVLQMLEAAVKRGAK